MWKILTLKHCALSSAKSFLQRNSKLKKTVLMKQKHGYLIHILSDKAFKGTVVNLAMTSLHVGSHEITFRN